ncbi:photosystem I P700 chlorophyll A apoprotein A2 [Tanacetum coccineum]
MMVPHRRDIDRMLEESPMAAGKWEKLNQSVNVLRESKESVARIRLIQDTSHIWKQEYIDITVAKFDDGIVMLWPGDFLVHHAITLCLHTTTLILVKGALDARGSKLMPHKRISVSCDGPGRGGSCDILAWEAFDLAVFWMLNTIGWVTFYWHWKHITLWQGNVSQFNESSTYLMGWLRDYLWLNSSQLINGYNPFGMNSLSVWAWMFLFGHLVWATGFMFLISWRGYWQELIETLAWAHERTPLANLIRWRDKPVALSIVQARLVSLVDGEGSSFLAVVTDMVDVSSRISARGGVAFSGAGRLRIGFAFSGSPTYKKPEYVKSEERKEDKKEDGKKRDMNNDEQVLLAEDQAWMKSSNDSDQELCENMIFMAKMEMIPSDSEESSSSAEEIIDGVSYYTSDSESESESETSKYYDNSNNYGLFVDNDDDKKLFMIQLNLLVKNLMKIILYLRNIMMKKELRPSLYDEKVIGLRYTPMFLTHSDEALEIKKFKRASENKILFAYDYGNLNESYLNEKIKFSNDYFQELINPDFEKIDSLFQQTSSLKPYVSYVILEKIIIGLEDEVVSLLEKEKEIIIKSLKLKGFESCENAIYESKNQSENDCQVVEKGCDNLENSKVIALGMFKINVSQSVSPILVPTTSCASNYVDVRSS